MNRLSAKATIIIEDMERRLAGAQAALKCQVCGKLKAYTAICFDCLGEDVEEIARWHREVELSDGDGTSDICSQCHTGWPCDAIKALKLLAEAEGKLDAVRKGASQWGESAVAGVARILKEGE